jgi:hypothetical protein
MEVCPAFIDETGVLSGSLQAQPIYGVGVLIVPETGKITDSFYRLHYNFVQDRATTRRQFRKELQERGTTPTLAEVERLMWSTRHHEYKFSEVTQSNLQQYIDILNLYFSFPDLEFHSLVLDRLHPDAGLDRWHNDEWAAYAHFTRELLEKTLKRDIFAIVDLQGEPKRSNLHLEDVLCSVPSVKGCLRATSDMSIYLQLVDVLLGCVQFDMKDQTGFYATTSIRAQAKGQVTRFLKTKLGMGWKSPFLPGGQSFRSWNTPSTFSVRRGEW